MTRKKNIVLDLDQTLISAEPTEEYDKEKNKEKAKKFTSHQMENYYIVFERPHLQKFLDFIFAHFNVSVWTAASKEYAMFIINKIIIGDNSKRKLNYVFFSHHCDLSKKNMGNTKHLKMLWEKYKLKSFNYENTFILDDYVEDVYDCQKTNCIIAPPFEFTKDESEDDDFLDKLVAKLEKLKESSDIRPLVIETNGKSGEVQIPPPPVKKIKRFSPKNTRTPQKLLTV